MLSLLNSSKYLGILGIISLISTGCSSPTEIFEHGIFKTPPQTFTQDEKFSEIIASQSSLLPSKYHQELLIKYQPDLYIDKLSEGPIDFYQDYIKYGCLETHDKDSEDCEVTPEDLNAVKHRPDAEFIHIEPGFKQVTPVAYGNIYQTTVIFSDLKERVWTFLRYNFVFRQSGIAAGVTTFEDIAVGLGGDLDDWHQLDHYTGMVVVLNEVDKPIAVMLQQHNYMRTYLIDTHPAFPSNGKFKVDAAIRSNEIFPHQNRETNYRSAGFLTAETVGWLSGVSEYRTVLATYDVTKAERQVRYELKFLPANDAFYVFAGRLGEHRNMIGRDGPPGAIFYTLPEIWPYEIAMAMYYWVEPDQEFADAFQDFSLENPYAPYAKQKKKLEDALIKANLLN